MAITPLHARNVYQGLGADCPCFANMLSKAQTLGRKRNLEEDRSGNGSQRIVARKLSVLRDNTGAFTPKTMQGDGKLKLFNDFLGAIDKRYMKRSMGQREFHQAFTVACLPHIIGEEEFEQHRAYYLEKFDLDEFKSDVLVTTPRRVIIRYYTIVFVDPPLISCRTVWQNYRSVHVCCCPIMLL